MGNVLVSVIVPVYKVEKYIDRCVKSLLDQDFDSYEIILVDDGSPDNCPKICDEYGQQNSCIKVLHKTNGGLGDARNYGVKYAEADYIIFVDSDDYVEKSYISDLWKLKEQFDADLVITKVVREPENSSVIKRNDKFPSYCTNPEGALLQVYGGGKVGWQAYGKLYHRETLLKYPFPDGYYEDCAVMYKIIHSVDKIAIGDFEGNYHYIDRQGSILRSELKKEHLRIFTICKKVKFFIEENYPQLDIIPILVYKKGLVQLLHLQSMSNTTYKKLYYKYQPIFRKNIKRVLCNKTISNKNKISMVLLCMPVSFYRIQYKIKNSLKK